jgi:hypothetical protein
LTRAHPAVLGQKSPDRLGHDQQSPDWDESSDWLGHGQQSSDWLGPLGEIHTFGNHPMDSDNWFL